jgi:hypothetical protein
LSAAQQIQVFSLPSLRQVDVINLNFQPYCLASAADGKLYCSTTQQWDYLREVDPATGTVVGKIGTNTYEPGTMIRINAAGTDIYVESSISGLDDYATSATGLPVFQRTYPFTGGTDFVIDAQYQRVYGVTGGVYGIEVTDLAHGLTGTVWPFNAPYGAALCMLPQGNFVYGASYFGGIRRFNRADGTPLADFNYSDGYQTIYKDLVITANGNVLYGKNNGSLNKLGLIGSSTLTISPPSAAPAVYAGSDITTHLSQGAALSATVTDSVTNVPVTWSVASGPGGATINSTSTTGSTISFSAPGTYQVESTAVQGSLTGSDIINVTVLPDPVAVSVTASATNAVPGGQNGAFTFSRTGSPVGAFAVNYTVSGSAKSPDDYTANLTGTATIPDGSSSVTIPITATANASHGTVTTTLATSANYQLGVSQAATVTIVVPQLYSQWAAPLSPSDQDPAATPQNDGVPNLLKYLFDIGAGQPMSVSDYQAMPAAGFDTSSVPGTSYVTLTYRENAGMSGVQVMVQTSSDLQTWSPPQAPDLSKVLDTPAANGDPMIEIGVKSNGLPTQFIRMNVIQ